MNTIEERLWDYIDGGLPLAEQQAIEALIASDSLYKAKYEELLAVQQLMAGMELEEPSMGFTNAVMDKVALEPLPVALKTKVGKGIIYLIGAFFAISILYVLFLIFRMPASSGHSSQDLLFGISINWDLSKYFSSSFIRIFLLVDMMMGLYLLDGFIRHKFLYRNRQNKGI